MNETDFDAALAQWLAPPADRAPDRIFAARIDESVSDLARLRAAERHYARGFLRELAALLAVAMAGLLLAFASGWASTGWLIVLPVGMLMLVLLGSGRQPRAGSSSTP